MTETRRCAGSAKYGIEPHDAPVEDFPKQPSQRDGIGRMCKVHWSQYTAGLARDAKARKTAETEPSDLQKTEDAPVAAPEIVAPVMAAVAEPAPKRTLRTKSAAKGEQDAG